MHPHHHGSSALQTQSASVPVIIDAAPGVGFDYLDTPSCQAYRQFFDLDHEVILHMQVGLSEALIRILWLHLISSL